VSVIESLCSGNDYSNTTTTAWLTIALTQEKLFPDKSHLNGSWNNNHNNNNSSMLRHDQYLHKSPAKEVTADYYHPD